MPKEDDKNGETSGVVAGSSSLAQAPSEKVKELYFDMTLPLVERLTRGAVFFLSQNQPSF